MQDRWVYSIYFLASSSGQGLGCNSLVSKLFLFRLSVTVVCYKVLELDAYMLSFHVSQYLMIGKKLSTMTFWNFPSLNSRSEILLPSQAAFKAALELLHRRHRPSSTLSFRIFSSSWSHTSLQSFVKAVRALICSRSSTLLMDVEKLDVAGWGLCWVLKQNCRVFRRSSPARNFFAKIHWPICRSRSLLRLIEQRIGWIVRHFLPAQWRLRLPFLRLMLDNLIR
jgi:hypothetical protein